MTPHQAIVQLIGNTFGSGDEWAADVLGAIRGAGYAIVLVPEMSDDDLVNEMSALIYERSQMTQGDADDLAWDLLGIVREARDNGYRH